MSDNPFSDNPYQASTDYRANSYSPPPTGEDSYVKQIPIVGILTIVQASLELIMCVLFVGLTIFSTVIFNDPKFQQQFQERNAAPPVAMLMGVYGVLAFLIGCIGLLRLISGIQLMRHRGRMMAIIMSVVGLTTVCTAYCSLTSIGICVYSLIVLLQPSVAEHFARMEAERGR